MNQPVFDRPIIILAAPRSGSTLLFETLSQAPSLWTVGGESHQLIESIRSLSPVAGNVDSNRLEARDATQPVIETLRERFRIALIDRDGHALERDRGETRLRFLEKTPKNALRQPFLERVFPGALYIHLFRDPRPNISSMMEAWKSGRWITYPRLRGWKGPPWSLLLPPGWQTLKGRPLPEICAFQWATANQTILDDLSSLPEERWTACSYDEVTQNPEDTIRRLCRFAGLEFDERLQRHVSAPLPLSRYTHTKPDSEKWRRNEALILPQMDSIADVWRRCREILSGT